MKNSSTKSNNSPYQAAAELAALSLLMGVFWCAAFMLGLTQKPEVISFFRIMILVGVPVALVRVLRDLESTASILMTMVIWGALLVSICMFFGTGRDILTMVCATVAVALCFIPKALKSRSSVLLKVADKRINNVDTHGEESKGMSDSQQQQECVLILETSTEDGSILEVKSQQEELLHNSSRTKNGEP